MHYFAQAMSVESIPAHGNGRFTDKVSHLQGKETDNGRTEKNRQINMSQYKKI